jgi:hypothetical protein
MATPALPSNTRSTRALKITVGLAGALYLLGAPSSLAFVLATTTPDTVQITKLMPAIFAALLLVMLPPLAGFTAAVLTSDPRAPAGHRQFRTVIVVSAVLVLAGALTLVLSAGSGWVSGGATAVIVGGSVILTAGSLAVGLVIRRRDAARARVPWKPQAVKAATVRTYVLRVAWTFVITLLVAVVSFVLLGVWGKEEDGFILTGVLLAISIAFIAASMACLVVVFPLSFRARDIFDGDAALQRRVTKMVAGRPRTSTSSASDERLDADASAATAAARYASVAAILLPFQLSQSGLILAGVAFGQLSSVTMPDNDLIVLNIVLVAFVVIVAPIATPFALRQLRRVRKYRDDHPVETLMS